MIGVKIIVNRFKLNKYKLASLLTYLFFFLLSGVTYAEEFVTFSHASSEFTIDMPNLSQHEVGKIDHQQALSSPKIRNVVTFDQLSKALDEATGGEVIVVRRNLRNQRFHYKQKHRFNSPVLILGMLENNKAPYLDHIVWEHLHNVTISHFKINNLNANSRTTYSWQIRKSNNVRLTNLHFMGNHNNLTALKQNNTKAILNSPSGLYIKEAGDILIDRTLFSDLYHAVEFGNITGFYAVANKAVRIASDMFSGGGVVNALFDSNLSHTRTPVSYMRYAKKRYIHSDMIQLYTTKMKQGNQHITIKNNLSLVGDTPLRNPSLTGWQCFFTRDERGDSVRYKNMPYSNVSVINNICASNQHHGVTLARGKDGVIAGNFVLLVDDGKTSREATGSIKVFDNHNCKIVGNVTHVFELRQLSGCDVRNNIHEYKPDYRKTMMIIKSGIKNATKRTRIERNSTSHDLSRYYKTSDLVSRPLQFLDYSAFTLVPDF
jgi:hypothetical protein